MDEQGNASSATTHLAPNGWVFVDPEVLPERWKNRARLVCLVPMLPGESDSLFGGEPVIPSIDQIDESILNLVARGLTDEAIANELDLASRSVQRRLARVRNLLQVGSKHELVTVLRAKGFG